MMRCCRIYRQFIQSLINDRSIRTGGSSGLFYFTVLCNYANFRTSYRRIDGIGYTIYLETAEEIPGCSVEPGTVCPVGAELA